LCDEGDLAAGEMESGVKTGVPVARSRAVLAMPSKGDGDGELWAARAAGVRFISVLDSSVL
jgi:hypothetical protein